jgi:AraC family transcriptional regulator
MSASPRPLEPEDNYVARTRYIDGASFLLCDAPKPMRFGVHQHENVRISFLLRGSIIEIDERDRRVECGPFSLHTTPAGMKHAHLIQSPRITTLCFDLERSMLDQLGDTAAVFDSSVTVKRGTAIALAPKFQREVLATDSASALVLQGLIYELAGELSRRAAPKLSPDAPAWLRRAREMLHDLWNQSVSIEEIAVSVGVHPSHLNRVFRAHMNQTPGEYLRAIRMDRSTREVLATDLPLKAIAARAGFSDQAHFTREFRRHHGQSPLEMRRSARDQ